MDDQKELEIKSELAVIREAIIKSGGDPAKQLASYILSEDPIYIPDIDRARSIARRLDAAEILYELISEYFD